MNRLDAVRRHVSRATFCCLVAASSSSAQRAPAQPVNLAGRELAVLRDVIAQQWSGWREHVGEPCFDPTVALFRGNGSSGKQRWSAEVVSQIARDVSISFDTLTVELPAGMSGCTRSSATWRLAYGRPRILGNDEGAIVFIGTRLDARGGVDSSKVDFRLGRKDGRWNIEGILADSATARQYVKGDGCYRLWYGQLEPGPFKLNRPETTEVRAESIFVRQNWRTFPAFRLTAGPRSLGVATERWSHSEWFVTHDSLHLQWSMENYVISADMLVAGDTLRGTMRSETDAVVPNPPTTFIGGRRIPCGGRGESRNPD